MTNQSDAARQMAMFGEEIGSSRQGTDRYGYSVHDSDTKELRGERRIRVLREMRRSDPIVGALIMAIKMIARTVPWVPSDPPDAEEGDTQVAEAKDFLESCMSDMSHPWSEFIDDALDAVWAGFAVPEIVMKQRLGPNPGTYTMTHQDGTTMEQNLPTSDYDDGLIGWRKLAYRDPVGVVRWDIDNHGGISGFWHRVKSQPEVYIPIEKCILFRASRDGNDPQGYSWLTNAHEPWQYKRKHQWLEAVGMERAGLGLPTVRMPLGSNTTEGSTDIVRARALVRGIRNDSFAGVVLPPPLGKEDHQKWDLELKTAGNTAGVGDTIIRRLMSEIMTSVLAQFLVQGMQTNGAYAMSKDHRDLWQMAVSGLVQTYQEIMNRFLVKPLFRMNQSKFPDHTKWPVIAAGDVAQYDITKVMSYVHSMYTDGILDVNDDDRNRIRDMVGWPNETQAQISKREEAEQLSQEQADMMQANFDNAAQPPADVTGNVATNAAQPPNPAIAGREDEWTEVENFIGKPLIEWTQDDFWNAALMDE